MGNFDFLKEDAQFKSFADMAVRAERLLGIDPEACAIGCRKAMEFAIKWMYTVDHFLRMPYKETLVAMINTNRFRELVPDDLMRRIQYVRALGNNAAHAGVQITYEQAALGIENLFYFMDFVACSYSRTYDAPDFHRELLGAENELEKKEALVQEKTQQYELNIQKLIEENRALKDELSARREERMENYVPKPLDLTEFNTRKIYIDVMLAAAGWTKGKDWLEEVRLEGMPNASGEGFADYVLYGDDGRPLAVVEAKRTSVNVENGRIQARLYADIMEKEYGRRPVVFLSNGFEMRIIDNQYPERPVAEFYSKRDLEKLHNLQRMREPLTDIRIRRDIAGRYYQEAAVKAVCRTLGEENRRKALLVMATGSGKTRTVISLVEVLQRKGWVKNVLFLADRTALVTQAKRSFGDQLPNLSVTNLCEDKENYGAACVFATYQTMIGCIDSVNDEDGKRLFTPGHFDLVICDEAHRSIYNKYRDIFNYFDAPLVGLTATPKDEIDKNTYGVFNLKAGQPTYGYELAQAVTDGYLVNYVSVESKLKFMENGINYDDLTPEEQDEFENTFEDEDFIPKQIDSSALNQWLFNKDTIRKVLDILMTKGHRVHFGKDIGKTIIFAKNHLHAEEILKVFNEEYPKLTGYAEVIDNQIKNSQQAIDTFSNPKKLPQIAISVDMLDTGIDVPEVLNLVFFKKVMSKSKFWQMIGRGTRLCEGLLDGADKENFYIFDFCGNFEFFRLNPNGREVKDSGTLQGQLYRIKFALSHKLQDLEYQTEPLMAFRNNLVDEMLEKVRGINKEGFAARQHLRYIEKYLKKDNYKIITDDDESYVKEEIAPLLQGDSEDARILRFDSLMYGIELAHLEGKKTSAGIQSLQNRVGRVAKEAGTIPAVKAQKMWIDRVLDTEWVSDADMNDFESVRKNLRELMIYYQPPKIKVHHTDFEDEILEMKWDGDELENDYLKDYRHDAEVYIRQHPDHLVIGKLKSNIPLTKMDVEQLEQILWSEVGSKEDYEKEYGDKPLGELVREIVGMDMNAAKAAFADYLENANLNDRQIYFVNQIVEYIVRNGIMKDVSVLQDSPFTDRGNIIELFGDSQDVWSGIMGTIRDINRNADIS